MPNQLSTLRNVGTLLRRINIGPAYFVAPVALSMIAASLEGAGMTLLIPLLGGFLNKDYSFITDIPALQAVFAYLPSSFTGGDRPLFLTLLGLFVITYLLKNVLRYLASLGMAFLYSRAQHHLRKLLFNLYLGFGKAYFDKTNLGHHSAVFSQYVIMSLLPILVVDKFMQALLSLVVYFAVMCAISWKLTLIAIPLFLLLHVSVSRLIRQIQTISVSIKKSMSELSKKVVGILSVIPLVQAFNTQESERRAYTAISDAAATLDFRKTAAQQLVRPVQEIVMLFALLALFVGMTYILVHDRSASASSFIVYFYVVVNAANKFAALTGFRGDMAHAAGFVEEVMHVIDPADKEHVPDGAARFPGLQDAIVLRDVRFSYGRREVLKGLSFTVKKGEVTAIVGLTGAGKSTVINLLLRYYDCPPNAILLDGKDIRSFTAASLRTTMALVSQDTLLLHDTLRANIAYGREEVGDAEMREAVRASRLEELVSRLPNGLDTLIGDRGVMLSGGEKQRVSIARALLRKAGILLLDEATSSLDSKTETLIQEAIAEAIKDRTAIVIAHRLSTVKNADRIVVMEDGRCVEEGTHQELLSKQGKFAAFWEAQRFA